MIFAVGRCMVGFFEHGVTRLSALSFSREFDDIVFKVAPVSQRGDGSAASRDEGAASKSVLIFYYWDSLEEQVAFDDVVAAEFSGAARYGEWLRQLCEQPCYGGHFQWRVRHDESGCSLSLDLRLADDKAQPAALVAFDILIDKLLSEVMVYSRPLRHYTGAFFLPIELDNDGKTQHNTLSQFETALNRADEWESVTHRRYSSPQEADNACAKSGGDADRYAAHLHAQEYFYFNPQIREFLYQFSDGENGQGEGSEQPIKSWRYRPQGALSVYHQDFLGKLSLYAPECQADWGEADRQYDGDSDDGEGRLAEGFVSGVRLHLFYRRIALLEIEVQPIVTPREEQSNNDSLSAAFLFPNWPDEDRKQQIRDGDGSLSENNEAARPRGEGFGPRSPLSIDTQGRGWWRDLVFGDVENLIFYRQMQVGRWLVFSKCLRLLYPAYSAHESEPRQPWIRLLTLGGDTRFTRRPNGYQHRLFVPREEDFSQSLSPVIAYWLEEIAKNSVETDIYRAIANYSHDDRLFGQLTYCLAGSPPSSFTHTPVDPTFALALYLDAPQDTSPQNTAATAGHACDPEFLAGLMDWQVHRRWQKNGILSGFTDYSNVFMGYGDFFAQVIAREHTPHHYRRMLMVALLYQNTLRYFSRKIGEATDDLLAGGRSNHQLSSLRCDYLVFTSRYWFAQLSSQLQAKEIFSRQKRALGLQEEYAFIQQQIDRSDSYLIDQYNTRMQRLANAAAAIALLFAATTIGIDVLNFVLPAAGDYPQKMRLASLGFPLLLVVGIWLSARLRLFRPRWQVLLYGAATAGLVGGVFWFWRTILSG